MQPQQALDSHRPSSLLQAPTTGLLFTSKVHPFPTPSLQCYHTNAYTSLPSLNRTIAGSQGAAGPHLYKDLFDGDLPQNNVETHAFDDTSPPELMASGSSVVDSSTTPTSTLTTPLLRDHHPCNLVVGSQEFDLNELLSQPMYDCADNASVTTTATTTAGASSPRWNSLFAVAEETPSPLFASEQHKSSVRPAKRQRCTEDDNEPDFVSKRVKPSHAALLSPSLSPSPSAPGRGGDRKAERRARNTLAARKSREKKRERLQELEDRVAELEMLNTKLAIENQFLRELRQMPKR